MLWKKDLERRLKHLKKSYAQTNHPDTLADIKKLEERIATALEDTLENVEAIRKQRLEAVEQKVERRKKWAKAARQKAAELRSSAEKMADAIPFGQPILIGHYSAKSDINYRNRFMRKFERSHEEDNKADRHEAIADAIVKNVSRVRGDAERARQQKRKRQDTLISVGSLVHDFAFGAGTVLRVNKNTYTIQFASGWKTTRDKTYVKAI
jgi:predicted house-cleaning noncanonical NTP pyrophosphatase (MazG superfamily)